MTRDRKRGGHGFRKEFCRPYICGLAWVRVSVILRVFYFLYGAVPGYWPGGVNLIPKKWTLENYKTALNSAPIMLVYDGTP